MTTSGVGSGCPCADLEEPLSLVEVAVAVSVSGQVSVLDASVSGQLSVLDIPVSSTGPAEYIVETGMVAIGVPSVASRGANEPSADTTVASHAGRGVIKVSDAVIDALLAVTVTSKPSVTVINTVGYTEPVYVTNPVHVTSGVLEVVLDESVSDNVGLRSATDVSLLLVEDDIVVNIVVEVVAEEVEAVIDVTVVLMNATVEFPKPLSFLHIFRDPLNLSACTCATNSNATETRNSILPSDIPKQTPNSYFKTRD